MALRGLEEASEEAGDYGISRLYSSSALIPLCGILSGGNSYSQNWNIILLIVSKQQCSSLVSHLNKPDEYVIKQVTTGVQVDAYRIFYP